MEKAFGDEKRWTSEIFEGILDDFQLFLRELRYFGQFSVDLKSFSVD